MQVVNLLRRTDKKGNNLQRIFIMKSLLVVLFLLLVSVFSVKSQYGSDQLNIDLQTGDLLFCGSTSGELSKAIDQATQTKQSTHFDHVGIVEIRNDTVWVLNASPEKGVCCETISQFISAKKEKITATVYRLKGVYSKNIPEALLKARTLLGQPYNFTYMIKDKGYYCSEFIYELFAGDSVFTLNPMTFKNPQTGNFLPGWVDHYQKLGIPIPEGEPGCNPNGVAASDKLVRVGELIVLKPVFIQK